MNPKNNSEIENPYSLFEDYGLVNLLGEEIVLDDTGFPPNETVEKPKFSDDDISSIQSNIEEKELIEEDYLEEMKKLKTKMGIDKIALGKLFVFCYDTIDFNVNNLGDDEELHSKFKQIIEDVEGEENKFVNELRILIEDYGDGEEINSYYSGERIRDLAGDNRKVMIQLVILFFKIFGENDG